MAAVRLEYPESLVRSIGRAAWWFLSNSDCEVRLAETLERERDLDRAIPSSEELSVSQVGCGGMMAER